MILLYNDYITIIIINYIFLENKQTFVYTGSVNILVIVDLFYHSIKLYIIFVCASSNYGSYFSAGTVQAKLSGEGVVKSSGECCFEIYYVYVFGVFRIFRYTYIRRACHILQKSPDQKQTEPSYI